MFLPALVVLVGLLATGWSHPAAAGPAAEAAPRYEPALEVSIDSLTPGALPADDPIRITGTVTNADDVAWQAVKMYSFLDDAPMLEQDELTEAAASDPLDDVGQRIVEEPASYLVGDLEPGQSAQFSLTVARSYLTVTEPGVYWFGVHAMGQSSEVARDDVADGRARTFLPYIPDDTPGQLKTALVLPIRHFLPYADDGSLDGLEHWKRTLSAGGRLRDLVEFAASSGGAPLTWLVDPAVPDAILRLARGNPPRSLDPSIPQQDEEAEEPGESPSGETSATADPDGPPEEEPELTAEERAAGEAALSWLGSFQTALQGDEVLALPYGDLDVAAAAEIAPKLYEAARARPSNVLTEWGITTTPAIVSPSGYLNDAGFEIAPEDATVMITDRAFTGDHPGVAEIDGKNVAVMSSGAAAGGPRPGDRFTTLQLRQRILSEAAVRLLNPGRHPLVVALPLEWEPGEASAFFSGLDVDWLELSTVADATDRDGSVVDPAELDYPETQQRRQLDPEAFDAVRELVGAGELLQNLLTLNTTVSATVTDQALAGASYGSRESPVAARSSLVDSQAWIVDLLDRVTISAGPGVTLSGSDGGFAAVIDNDLDQPVTVNVVGRSNGGVEISSIDPIELAANSRSTVVLDAHANRVGVTNVTLAVTDADGTELGATYELPIRSAQVSAVIWLIIGTGLGLLFLAILVRLVRRIRGGSKEPEVEATESRVTCPVTCRDPGRGDAVTEPQPAVTPSPDNEQAGILASSAVMAAGTVVSRLSGFVRSTLLAAALGLLLHADIFTIANTVPNMLYILLAGGVFNAVLVPQLVRAMKQDPDGGEAYTNRVITLAALFLGAVTVLLVVAAPVVMSIYLDGSWGDAALSEQRQSVIDFARFCLPQVFFYGMFVLVGQILNSRGRFGPMMWAPIANNVISVAVLVIYLFAFGPARGAETTGGFSSDQELLLGIGSTVGIVAQLLILVPYLRSAGFRYRPRFDFLHTGLAHTFKLGVWTVLFVIVNQVAYTIVIRLASGGTTGAVTDGGSGDGTGATVYAAAFLIVMVPHSVITVSLTTAILPRLSQRAADGELAGLAHTLASTLRTALTVVVPFAALLPIVAPDIANVVWGHAAARLTYDNAVPTLSLFGAGVVFFTVHFLMLRGFYALEQTRTVFYIQCAVAVTNIAAALILVGLTDDEHTAPALVLAYTAAYVVGSVISYATLRRRLGGLETPALVGFLVVLLIITAATTAVAFGLGLAVHSLSDRPHWAVAALQGAGITMVAVIVFVWLARRLRLHEVTSVLDQVRRRIPVGRKA